jgi:hypothetical protein
MFSCSSTGRRTSVAGSSGGTPDGTRSRSLKAFYTMLGDSPGAGAGVDAGRGAGADAGGGDGGGTSASGGTAQPTES